MFSHLVIGTNHVEAAKVFYDGVLGTLGHPPGQLAGDRVVYATDAGILVVTVPFDKKAATPGNGITVGLNAPNPAAVDAFHAIGIELGGIDEGQPGPRTAIPGSYAAYLRDPTGNKILAWCMMQA